MKKPGPTFSICFLVSSKKDKTINFLLIRILILNIEFKSWPWWTGSNLYMLISKKLSNKVTGKIPYFALTL